METIKVNMSPNPLDVQTIHASQNDGEARQWEFELHNNGELIDTSEVTEQMFFKAYKGGTEEILPTNGSVPTTAPFLGDIRYPQGLLTDQEFTYRQSPTESDGLAKITDIKGNTLVWNQLVQNGNFADTSKWIKGGGASSLAISNNEAVITIGGAWNNDVRQNQGASFISGHKYFASFEAKASVPISLDLATITVTPAIYFARLTNVQTTFKKIASIVTAQTNANDIRVVLVENGNSYIGETFTVRNVQIIDLTAMGLDITSVGEFTSLFPLPYYDYNAGTLLSFNGTGLKSTSEDESKEDTLQLPISTYFPTGMKSAGSVYDELTESKAITRVGSRTYQSGDESDTSVITDGTTTYYALATPTETSFTTASLVTENAEIPLSNEDGVLIGKCTEQLSENPGFIDAKIKLSDGDGECYSNKIQLHVERSPQ